MCGASGQQTEIDNEQIQAYQEAQQLTEQQYANQQAIYGPMSDMFKSIFAAGPNQKGFSAGETEDLNAQTVEGTAENYKAAAQAVGEQEAGLGGGMNPLPSGAQEEARAQVAESAAQEESREESQIQQADYSQGLSDWQNAAAGLESIGTSENPLGFESAETSSGSAAATTANQIAQEQNSWIDAAIGAAGSIGEGWATGGFKT